MINLRLIVRQCMAVFTHLRVIRQQKTKRNFLIRISSGLTVSPLWLREMKINLSRFLFLGTF